MGLYSDILERLQDVNEYGGGAETFLIRQPVLDAIDDGANSNDLTLSGLRTDILSRMNAWRNVEDHAARSSFFDIYSEATFYLAGSKRIALKGIPRSSSSTPDFRTVQEPEICFEVKTLDVADPDTAYTKQMEAGLEGNIEAHEEAQRKGVGFSTQFFSPHGSENTWPEIMAQTMRKLSSHVKRAQYVNAPTFLVANLGRLAVRVDAEQLSPEFVFPGEDTFYGNPLEISGQLWTIANHQLDDAFYWVDPDGRRKSDVIKRAGLLRDFPFIQGIIFMNEPWSEFARATDWRDAYRFLGVWNEDCTLTLDAPVRTAARQVIDMICTRVVTTR